MFHTQRMLTTLVAVFAISAAANATVLTFDLGVEFSGATPPVGAAPWLRATFDDGGSVGSVKLTMTALNLTGNEFVGGWYFNLDPAMNPAILSFSGPTKIGSFTNPTIGKGVNAFKADGDGKYDLLFTFATSGGLSSRFTAGDQARYVISATGLTANSFNYLSAPDGGHGPFLTAAHVQGIGPCGDDSGWVTVPEPATMGLMTLGGVVGLIRRRRLGYR